MSSIDNINNNLTQVCIGDNGSSNAFKNIRFISWNIAGIRASCKRGDLDFLANSLYNIVCFQETKAEPAQIEPMISVELKAIYKHRYWSINPGTTQRKGFSGVAVWSRVPCLRVLDGMALDTEGRINALEFENFILVNVYTPNSQELDCERFEFRKLWDVAFNEFLGGLIGVEGERKPIIVCGDLNVAYLDIDIHNPKKYKNKVAGFLDDERMGFGRYVDENYVDSFRYINGNVVSAYTYWNQKMPHLRKNNIGWRIDYFLVSQGYASNIRGAGIWPHVMGSDHCPVFLEMSF